MTDGSQGPQRIDGEACVETVSRKYVNRERRSRRDSLANMLAMSNESRDERIIYLRTPLMTVFPRYCAVMLKVHSLLSRCTGESGILS